MADGRSELYKLLTSQALGVISRVGADGAPQSAVVGFTPRPHLDNGRLKLVIGPSKGSRKAANIAADHRVSFVVFDEHKRHTVQIEGSARLIDPRDLGEYRQLIIDRNPVSATYIDKPDQIYIEITPNWMRYSDVSVFPWEISEEHL